MQYVVELLLFESFWEYFGSIIVLDSWELQIVNILCVIKIVRIVNLTKFTLIENGGQTILNMNLVNIKSTIQVNTCVLYNFRR